MTAQPEPSAAEVEARYLAAMSLPLGTVATVEGRTAVLIGQRNGARRWQWINGDWTAIPISEVEPLGHVNDHTRDRERTMPTGPLVLRIPLDRALDNADGERLNVGVDHIDVPVVIDPDLPLRGERQNTYDGQRIVLREWNEQVLLHEILHVALLRVSPLNTVTEDPNDHNVISRIEVALWETGWRFRPDDATRDRELGERIAAWLRSDDAEAVAAAGIEDYAYPGLSASECERAARHALDALIARAESERARQHTRPYCLRCEIPIYRDDEGVWRREATGSQVCPRNPAVDGHEPLQHTGTGGE